MPPAVSSSSSRHRQCFCGRFLTQLPITTSDTRTTLPGISSSIMDASFVQVPLQQPLFPATRGEKPTTEGEKYRIGNRALSSLELLLAAKDGNNSSLPQPLCISCLQQHDRALHSHTERLDTERNDYQQAVYAERSRARGLQQTIERTMPHHQHGTVEDAFVDEIDMLTTACNMTRKELRRLQTLLREQAVLEAHMDSAQDMAAEERNTLALEARALDEDQSQWANLLTDLRDEGQRLSAVQLPLSLYHLSVDTERGLRYPLINDLRLAYRPKGDLNWPEISAAWALAAQLLLSIGTLFGFQSQNWRIVPLSHCAKIMYYPASGQQAKIFNLGHPNTKGNKALLTWNALLCQVMHHVHTKLSTAKYSGGERAAYAISPTTIGNLTLTKLSERDDDASWARAIHYMASNLLWLSTVTSRYLAQQVVLSLDTPRQPVGGETPSSNITTDETLKS